MIHLVRTCLVFLFLTLAIFALCATARRFKVRVADDGAPTKYGASLEKGNDWEAVKDALDWEEEKKTLVVDLLSNGDSTELAQRLLEVSKKMSSHMSGEGGDAQVRSALVSASGRVVDVASSTQGKRRVAVIGAGLSGLTTAKRLLEEGVHVLLVDKNVGRDDAFGQALALHFVLNLRPSLHFTSVGLLWWELCEGVVRYQRMPHREAERPRGSRLRRDLLQRHDEELTPPQRQFYKHPCQTDG